jgi:hypothetical protein
LAELKLSACATITGSVMRELAAAAAGPRDLVNCIASIHDRGGERISESEILEALRSDFVNETRSRGEVFGSVSRPSKYHRNAIEDTARTFSAIKAQGIGDDRVAGISADLRSVDILWFAIASAALQSQIADPGKTGPLYMYAFQEAGIYRLQCLTAAHTGILKDNLNVITEFKSGLSLLTAFDQGKGAPVRMIALSPRAGLSLLEQELTALRTRSLAYPGLPAAPRC